MTVFSRFMLWERTNSVRGFRYVRLYQRLLRSPASRVLLGEHAEGKGRNL